jgi:hypothetical protein
VIEPILAKSLDPLPPLQQAAAQGEVVLRQAEKRLGLERARREAQVEGGEEASQGEAAASSLSRRLPPEKMRRYRLAWKEGLGPQAELEPGEGAPDPAHPGLDLNA